MVIGIAGGTCSGKSSVASVLAAKLSAEVISLDGYFKDPATFPVVYAHPDYDRFEAIDWERVIDDLKSAPGNVVAEGFLLLANKEARDLIDTSFYIDLDEDELIERRLKREKDTAEGYIRVHVKKRHKELVVPTKEYADYVLDGHKSIEGLARQIIVTIHAIKSGIKT